MEEPTSITIPKPVDRHVHFRDGEMASLVIPYTAAQFRAAVVMPNLIPNPVTTPEQAVEYRQRIMARVPEGSNFTPIMTCYLTDHTSPKEVVRGFKEGAWQAVKLYMADQHGKGGTTGSAHGVRDLRGRYKVFEAMEKHGIPLLGHFEAVEDEVDEFDREVRSVERDLNSILRNFSDLKVVVEHLTDGRTADFVAYYPHRHLYATVTPQHLLLNRNALFKGGMNPREWCKPVLKREEHRRKVLRYVLSGNSRFGAGTDSAPHDETAKTRCCGCAAGIFSAPAAVELYTELFWEYDALQHLPGFLSENFIHIYGLEKTTETVTLERQTWAVPPAVSDENNKVHVFRGGRDLLWKLRSN